MADAVFLILTVAFFAAALGLVRACERVVGDEHGTDEVTAPSPPGEPERVAA
jgi:hypothetical protein